MKKKKYKIKRSLSGVILIEVMLALFLLVVGVTALSKIHLTIVQKSVKAQALYKSALIMESERAEASLIAFDQLDDMTKEFCEGEGLFLVSRKVAVNKELFLKRIFLTIMWKGSRDSLTWKEEVLRVNLFNKKKISIDTLLKRS
ncbi:hypothetical protein ACFL1T_00685 [Chlamydiota bacterium]